MTINEPNEIRQIRIFARKKDVTKGEYYDFLVANYINPDLEEEYMTKVVNNIVDVTFDYLVSLSVNKKCHFLNAINNLLKVALSLKLWDWYLSRKDGSWYWKGIPLFFSSITHIIEPLELMQKEISCVDRRRMHKKVILVEGDSEYGFLETIKIRSGSSNYDFEIYNYNGKGNRKNLVHYIKEKNRQGIKVVLTYDKDGKEDTLRRNLRESKCKIDGIFGFRRDFEHSFPSLILFKSIIQYSNNVSISIKKMNELLGSTDNFTRLLEKEIGIIINKPKLARLLGTNLERVLRYHFNDIYNNKNSKKYNAEIYKFLKYISTR
jgi:hypothetical protein